MKCSFYKTEHGNQIYAVSCPLWAPATQAGGAIMQTWVIAGEERIMAIDSPAPAAEGFRTFLENEFQRPVMMINSHGHIDHIGCNEQFDEVRLNERDWPLLLGGGVKPLEGLIDTKVLSYKLRPIQDYEEINLGNRKLLAIPIRGHTPGSMMMYDKQTKCLFSGDSVARRILYGLSGWTPVSEYLSALKSLVQYEIKEVYSMHDAFALPGDLPQTIINNITTYLRSTELSWTMPEDGQRFLQIMLGDSEADMSYFNFVMPYEKKEEVLKDIKFY